MRRTLVCSDGVRLFVEDSGPRDGAAFVFAHEFGGDWRSWDGLVARLGATQRCVRYAARGFHPSETPSGLAFYGQARATRDLAEVVDALELGSFHLVGCSMGSFTSLMFALEAPERLQSLTLIGCSSGPRDEPERAGYRAALLRQGDLLRSQGGDGAVLWLAQDPAYRQMPRKVPAVWRDYCARLRRQSVPGATQTLESLHWNRPSLFEREAALRGVQVPVDLIYGAEDHPLVEATAAFLSDVLPTARLFQVPATGHLVHLEEEPFLLERLAMLASI